MSANELVDVLISKGFVGEYDPDGLWVGSRPQKDREISVYVDPNAGVRFCYPHPVRPLDWRLFEWDGRIHPESILEAIVASL